MPAAPFDRYRDIIALLVVAYTEGGGTPTVRELWSSLF
jgi:hypothetical protein